MKTKAISTLFLFTFLLISHGSKAQKCEVKADPITGEQVIQFMNKYKTLRYEYTEGQLTDFYTTFSYRGEQNVSVLKGSEIIFKLKNGDIIKLTSVDDANPQTRILETIIISNYTYHFKLTKEQIDQLASDKIALMRYPSLDGGSLDWEVKGLGKIYASKITKGAQCLSENLQTDIISK